MMAEPVTLGGVAMIFASVVGMWIREWWKGKNQKSNGADLKEIKGEVKHIKGKVTTIDKNVGMIQTDMSGMKKHCEQTTQRFEKGINDNRKEILDLTKKKK